MVQQKIYASPLGRIRLVVRYDRLVSAVFVESDEERLAGDSGKRAEQEATILQNVVRWLDAYFSGENPSLDALPLDLSATAFQRKVWEVLVQIPYGKTMTYGDIAKQINCRSAQAVGGAIGKNPLAIFIPCHRVLGADNRLTGYAWGLERKAWLLEHERMEKK